MQVRNELPFYYYFIYFQFSIHFYFLVAFFNRVFGVNNPSAHQLVDWANKVTRIETATNINGAPLPSLSATQSAGENGPVLLEDANLLELLAHFNRERIVSRATHAKGAG